MDSRDRHYTSFKNDLNMAINQCEHKDNLRKLLDSCKRGNAWALQRNLLQRAIDENPNCVLLRNIKTAYNI